MAAIGGLRGVRHGRRGGSRERKGVERESFRLKFLGVLMEKKGIKIGNRRGNFRSFSVILVLGAIACGYLTFLLIALFSLFLTKI